MNDPQDSVIEPVESDPLESADSDLSDEALDRPQGGVSTFPLTKGGYTSEGACAPSLRQIGR